jgi:hypothetical protein
MSKKYRIGTTVGTFQLVSYQGTNEATNNHMYTARCRQCGQTAIVDSYTLQLGTMKACTKCSPTETRREVSAKEQLRTDRTEEAKSAALVVSEKQRQAAVQREQERRARLRKEFDGMLPGEWMAQGGQR